jgi:hypothetical protein
VKSGDLVCIKGMPEKAMSVRWVRMGTLVLGGESPVAVTCTWFKNDGGVAEFEFKYDQLTLLLEF